MLAATGFSLLVPGLARGGMAEVLAGFAVVAASMVVLDLVIPHGTPASRILMPRSGRRRCLDTRQTSLTAGPPGTKLV